MIYLDGTLVAKKIESLCAKEHQRYINQYGRPVALGVLRVGDNEASAIYVQHKQRMAQKLGFSFQEKHFPAYVPEEEIVGMTKKWASDLDGLIVQLPLPPGHDPHLYLSSVPQGKDVDGLHPFYRGFTPCTPLGCLFLLTYYGIPIAGQHCVVVGKSDLVGRPLANLLLQHHATVTVTHLQTKDLSFFTRQADMLFVCAGHKHLIQPADVHENAIIIDIGIHRTPTGMTGDVDPAVRVKAISPVPRGVGPLTVMGLMWNTLTAAFASQNEVLSLHTCLSCLREEENFLA